jgi:hypothetical protein
MNWFYRHSSLVVQSLMAPLLLLPAVSSTSLAQIRAPLILALVSILALTVALYSRFANWSARTSIYSASVLSVYLMTVNPVLEHWGSWINIAFLLLACILALAIRMTRRDQFRLDTQDLLILIMILVVPMLPFVSVGRFAIGEFTLRLAVLIYSCEFVVGKYTERRMLLPMNFAGVLSMTLAIVLNSAQI